MRRATGPAARRARSDRVAPGSGAGREDTARKIGGRCPPVRLGVGRQHEVGSGRSRRPRSRAPACGGRRGPRLPLTDFCDGPESVRRRAPGRRGGRRRPSGVDRIVVAGGDGSLGPARRCSRCAPACRSPSSRSGTANSFARWLELPLDLDEAVALAADPDAPTRTAEVASADGRPFVNVAATGLSVLAAAPRAAAQAAPRPARLRRRRRARRDDRHARSPRPCTPTGARCGRGDAWQVLVAATGAFGGDSSTGGVDTGDERARRRDRPGRAAAGARCAAPSRCAAGAWSTRTRSSTSAGTTSSSSSPAATREFNVDGEVLDLARRAVHRPGPRRRGGAADALARGAHGRPGSSRRSAPGTRATRCATGASSATATSCTAATALDVGSRGVHARRRDDHRRADLHRRRRRAASSTATRSSRRTSRRSAAPRRRSTSSPTPTGAARSRSEVAGALAERAEAGVEVNVVLDAMGSVQMERDVLEDDAARPACASRASARPSRTRGGG